MSIAVQVNSKPSNSTDALFRAWGSMISTQLAAAGMVLVADSGDLDWTTILAPIAASTAAGYEIWRFADALQAAKPVFFKLEYGSGAAAATPALWITFGSGSDGAGTLSGTLSTRMSLPSGSSYTTNNQTSYFSGDTGRFVMGLWMQGTGVATTTATLVAFERSVDGVGAPTGDAVLFVAVHGTGTLKQVAWNTTTGPTTAVETSLGAMGPSVGSGSSGSQVSVYPIFHTQGSFFNPGLNVMAYFNADIPAISTLSITLYGVVHTFVTLGAVVVSIGMSRAATTTSLMMRYE